MTTPERVGRWEAMWMAIEDLLRLKFEDAGIALMPEVKTIFDFQQLRDLHLAIAKATSLEEVRGAFSPRPTSPAEG
jgi:hypothetical protein